LVHSSAVSAHAPDGSRTITTCTGSVLHPVYQPSQHGHRFRILKFSNSLQSIFPEPGW
jgi:hypothetical protein